MPGHGGNRTYDLWNTSQMLKPARCGYTLRVTSQASYSPEYITPRQKISVLLFIENNSRVLIG
jgi:hypothetical protein